jgi:hypothetical protein
VLVLCGTKQSGAVPLRRFNHIIVGKSFLTHATSRHPSRHPREQYQRLFAGADIANVSAAELDAR